MPTSPLPARDRMRILFSHVAYRFAGAFARRGLGIAHDEVHTFDELKARVRDADVLVVSGLWKNELLDVAPKLRLIQSISAGTDQYDKPRFKERGLRLASAQGVNAQAVAEHAIALMLALARKLPEARDNQATKRWRGMISDAALREDELGGKTLLIVGAGGIGQRLARLAKAFDMRVIGTRRTAVPTPNFDEIHADRDLARLIPHADVVALTCPLTPETTGLVDARMLAAMKPTAHLINVARGKVVDEPALIEALSQGRIAAAGIDVTVEEPLPPSSPLWSMPNVLLTPHTAGETSRYEERVIDLLVENISRLERGETALANDIV